VAGKFGEKLGNVARNFGDGLVPYLPEYFPVAWKLGISISLMITFCMAVLGSVILNSQSARMQSQADSFGTALAAQLSASAREPLLASDDFTLQVLLNNLTNNDNLLGASLFDHDGQQLIEVGTVPANVLPALSDEPVRWQQEQTPLSSYFARIEQDGTLVGFAAVTVSRQPIIDTQQKVRETIVTATVLMGIVAIIVSFIVSRRLSRPIHNLLHAAREMRAGNLDYRIQERRNDEIGKLIDAYNTMAVDMLEKDQVERVLSRFVSPSVAKRMMSDLDQVSLGGREVEATVVFADIVGFTSLSENMAPDAVAEMLNGYFDAITMASTFYRGTIDKYMGDCAMIVFGVPEDDSEHLFHGLCCAVMIQRLIERLNVVRSQRGLTTVDFRIGINYGEMLAGNLGSRDRMQYTVVGDAVNLASRLSNMAGAGQVVAPEAVVTDANIAPRIRFEPAGSMQVRGKTDVVSTFLITGVHAHSETLMEQRIAQFLNQIMETGLRMEGS
jgi:adenylate cyclase